MRIFDSVGAIDIESQESGVVITQQDIHGGEEAIIFIPHALVSMVCRSIRETSKEGVEI